jgi:hypothetical protein
MQQKLIINAVIRTEGPLSIRMPVAEGARENEFKNFPVMTRGVDSDGNPLRTGYLPATTLRGFLRRAVALRNMRAAAESGEPYKLPQIYSEMIGQDAASEKQSDQIDLAELRLARQSSPVLDLFGSGLGIKSRLKVSHFVPERNILPEVFSGVRKDLDDTEEALDLLSEEDLNAFLGRAEKNRLRAGALGRLTQLQAKVKRDERKGVVNEDEVKALEIAQLEVETFKEAMGEMQNSSRTLVSHFALPAGLALSGRIVVDRARDGDAELIEHGLNELSLNPVLGAQSARGCGEISGTFDFLDSDGRQLKTVVIGGYRPARITSF